MSKPPVRPGGPLLDLRMSRSSAPRSHSGKHLQRPFRIRQPPDGRGGTAGNPYSATAVLCVTGGSVQPGSTEPDWVVAASLQPNALLCNENRSCEARFCALRRASGRCEFLMLFRRCSTTPI
jgi:hypothetical protein